MNRKKKLNDAYNKKIQKLNDKLRIKHKSEYISRHSAESSPRCSRPIVSGHFYVTTTWRRPMGPTRAANWPGIDLVRSVCLLHAGLGFKHTG